MQDPLGMNPAKDEEESEGPPSVCESDSDLVDDVRCEFTRAMQEELDSGFDGLVEGDQGTCLTAVDLGFMHPILDVRCRSL